MSICKTLISDSITLGHHVVTQITQITSPILTQRYGLEICHQPYLTHTIKSLKHLFLSRPQIQRGSLEADIREAKAHSSEERTNSRSQLQLPILIEVKRQHNRAEN